jgi:hypothetical protein
VVPDLHAVARDRSFEDVFRDKPADEHGWAAPLLNDTFMSFPGRNRSLGGTVGFTDFAADVEALLSELSLTGEGTSPYVRLVGPLGSRGDPLMFGSCNRLA